MPLTVSQSTITNPQDRGGFIVAFQEQQDFIRQKVNIPTARWDDIKTSGHDRGFMVAGAAKADLLTDLRDAVEKAVINGDGLDRFRARFDEIVAKHGWEYKGGRNWRTRVIYETNILASYAAGRYSQLTDPDLLKVRPIWVYHHRDSVQHPRPLHKLWGLKPVALRHDNPWWRTHFPPNGWFCHCWVSAAREGQYPLSEAPNDGMVEHIDKQGNVTVLPNGIDLGWNYTPGRTWSPQVDKYPHPIAKALVSDYAQDGVLVRWHNRLERQLEGWKALPEFAGLKGDGLIDALRKAGVIPFEQLVVGVIAAEIKALLASNSQALILSADTVVKQLVKREGQPIDAQTYANLQAVLDQAQVVKQVDGNKVAYWHQDGKIWYAVIKVTQDRTENFLVSLRLARPSELKKNLSADEQRLLGIEGK
ncbi:MAG: phage minor head protein [Methylovulum miyakonense]|uniref:phage head morphogenesis protein n=1 Tax=Methylovulum miyakonense TaxID=645578 RepID=UPI003BB6E7A6